MGGEEEKAKYRHKTRQGDMPAALQTVKQPREGLRNEGERSHHGSSLVPHGIISVVLSERRYIPGGSASEHLPLLVPSVY